MNKNKAPEIESVKITIGDDGEKVATGTVSYTGTVPVDATIRFQVSDDVEVKEVKALLNGKLITAALSEGTYTATFSIANNDIYKVVIEATDNMGATATYTFTLVVDNVKPTLVSLKAIDTVGNKVTAENGELQWEVGRAVRRVEAVVIEPVQIVDGASAVVYIEIEGTWQEYGRFSVDENDPTKIIITPDPSNATAALTGTFTFKVDAGVVKDLAGNTNDEITITLVVVVDETAPVITGVMLDGATVDNDGTATLNVTDVTDKTLSIKATDNVGAVSVSISGIGESAVTATYNEQTEAWEDTFEALAAGDYEIVITVKDAAGNENTFRFTLVVTEQELAG